MKKSLIATLVAAPLLTLSSLSFSAEPVLLNAAEMDGVTAGCDVIASNFDFAAIAQFNIGNPVTITQINALTAGSSNNAYVNSGNYAVISQ